MRPQCTPPRFQSVKLCACGCGQPTLLAAYTRRRYGQVEGQPLTYLHGHHSVGQAGPLWVVDDRGCWVWQRALTPKGYGIYGGHDGHSNRAHKRIYEQLRGTVPEGLELDHRCGNRACVNPDHLEIVPHVINVRRAKHVKLSIERAREIRALWAGGMSRQGIAERLGVGADSVWQVVKDRAWREHRSMS